MLLLLADTFTASLARLTGDEQKAVKTTAFDLQLNPASPGMRFHRLERARDRNFWSVRVTSDIRLIVHRTDDSLLLCYANHHDAAYDWAERRKIERHPVTGAAQLVEIRETVREIAIPRYVDTPTGAAASAAKKTLFDAVSNDDLLAYGVPAEWLDDVRTATEDTLFDLAGHLPAEAAEALLDLATGGKPEPRSPVLLSYVLPPDGAQPADVDTQLAFSHPDAQRRFRTMESADDLARALDAPWDAWTVFLHPTQQAIVSHRFNGPARVAGSAGTGKTVVALHRAVHLARSNPQARVLLTTVSDTLASALAVKLERLVAGLLDVRHRITVRAIDRVGADLYEITFGSRSFSDGRELSIGFGTDGPDGRLPWLTPGLVLTEWSEVVDPWQLTTWEAYRDVPRLGRKRRLSEAQRAVVWQVMELFWSGLAESELYTTAGVFRRLTEQLLTGGTRPFDFVVVDEAQDLGVPQLRFLAALGAGRPDALFFAGDLGQRIFQTPFSWKSLGIDIRGRSRTLRLNYRTSHQIRRQADRLLRAEIADVDGNTETRTGTVSAFTGPEPDVRLADSVDSEAEVVGAWLRARITDGLAPHEMAVFVRSDAELPRARAGVERAGLGSVTLDASTAGAVGSVAVGAMHFAKGLEYRAVVVAACDDEIVPLQARIESVSDEADLEDVYDTERNLLYVACTRARDWLLVTGVKPGSEFLGDLARERLL